MVGINTFTLAWILGSAISLIEIIAFITYVLTHLRNLSPAVVIGALSLFVFELLVGVCLYVSWITQNLNIQF